MELPNLIDGRALAEQIHRETAERIAALRARGLQPGLAFVRVGDDSASKVYVSMKERMSARLGLFTQTHLLAESATEAVIVTISGSGFETWSLVCPYFRQGGRIIFQPAQEKRDPGGELELLGDWTGHTGAA